MNKIPQPVRTIGFLFLFFTFTFTDCHDDEPNSEDFADTEIKAGIFEDCTPGQNFYSTNIYAESVMIDGIKRFLVGGYNYNETQELGFILPWPPAEGVYTLGSNSWAYYDPYVNENDTSNYLDQYATNYIEGTKIYIDHIILINESITSLDLRFDSIGVVNSNDEYLCLTTGRIWKGN